MFYYHLKISLVKQRNAVYAIRLRLKCAVTQDETVAAENARMMRIVNTELTIGYRDFIMFTLEPNKYVEWRTFNSSYFMTLHRTSTAHLALRMHKKCIENQAKLDWISWLLSQAIQLLLWQRKALQINGLALRWSLIQGGEHASIEWHIDA